VLINIAPGNVRLLNTIIRIAKSISFSFNLPCRKRNR
jgi:hypothetical protein